MKKRRKLGKTREWQLRLSPDEIAEAYSEGLNESREGVARLQQIAVYATALLTSLCYKKPELCAEIARQQLEWPVLFTPHHERRAEISELIEKIQLGAATPFELSGTYAFSSPGTNIAFKLVRLATTLRNNYSTGEWASGVPAAEPPALVEDTGLKSTDGPVTDSATA